MNQSLKFDRELLRKYDVRGPRYTSYPTAPQFSESVDAGAYERIAESAGASSAPLSLYVHIPFCRTVCFYCGCNKVITANYRRAGDYLERLGREMAMQARWFGRREVTQLHFGGGTPTYLDEEDLSRVMGDLRANFRMSDEPDREFSIEIDPRTVDPRKIQVLGELGFNRMSLGVQDFDPKVQRAVNRIQSVEQTAAAIEAGRAAGFRSTNIDLIYGLPRQTLDSFERTLDTVIALRQERLAVYSYAHLPQMFKVQRQIDAGELPDSETKLALLELTIRRLTEAGYVYIGMDHFALPDEELAEAQRKGTLQRNFQGYSTQAELDLVALGVSGISLVDDAYAQNAKQLDRYAERIDNDVLAVERGVRLSADDRLRRYLIQGLMCQGRIDIGTLEEQHKVTFREYFADALARLAPMAADGLIRVDDDALEVTPRGRLFLRNIAMAFDAYLAPTDQGRYSRAI
ncbi:MAG: oxygen-independent coproporphyrinogen III oxidase [Proteobacteria bacterium]|nr:MAG: oxygen-independent coproporphyrinogen III oxidase [Pseudomonadota bacterium]